LAGDFNNCDSYPEGYQTLKPMSPDIALLQEYQDNCFNTYYPGTSR
jgi:hypothetical protein